MKRKSGIAGGMQQRRNPKNQIVQEKEKTVQFVYFLDYDYDIQNVAYLDVAETRYVKKSDVTALA